ncbi:MAG: stage II sporulation protein M [Gemmatimonadota bacterium]|nr:stage II sporulation protein M [Gemmatimonadota bacterium]
MTASHVSTRLELLVDVETPEQVVFSYTVAGIGSRAAAALIDYLISFGALLLLWILLALLSPALSSDGGDAVDRMSGSWAIAIVILVQFALLWGYYVLFEALWDGQTPGKRRVGLRVVQDGGYSVSFAASAVRNLARLVDMQPGFFYGVGILSAAMSSSGKRLGDVLAGTIVVRERVVPLPTRVSPDSAADGRSDSASRAVGHTAVLTDAEYELLERFTSRRQTLEPQRRRELSDQLAGRFRDRLPAGPGPEARRLLELFDSEREARGRGMAARGESGAAREQHAIVALGAERWSGFARSLADAQRRGLGHMGEDDARAFVASYRELTSDLARLRTAARGRDIDALFYLSRLVAAGHNLLYRRKPLSMATAGRYLAVNVPREIRRSWRPILLASALLFGPGIVTYLAVLDHPALVSELLPARMIDRAERDAADCRKGKCSYVDVGDFERPVMATSIISNNVQVTYAVFVFGITAGIMTVFMLVFNGVSLGAGVGLFHVKGVEHLILDFVAAHSVFELSAICIAAGGGLLVAAALLLPGERTRREALVINGRRAIRLVSASTVLLVCAGSIEGLISPRTDIATSTKALIAALCAVLLAVYVNLGRGTREEEVREEFAYSDERALISR